MIKILNYGQHTFLTRPTVMGNEGVPIRETHLFTKTQFIEMQDRKLAITLFKPLDEEVIASDVVGMAELDIRDDGVYAEVKFFDRTILPAPEMIFAIDCPIRFLQDKPRLFVLSVAHPGHGEGKYVIVNRELVPVQIDGGVGLRKLDLFDAQSDPTLLDIPLN